MMSNLLKSKKEKNIIIDPLSCLIKLSILSFYPEGTKISVTDNQISFHEPSFYQGTIRYFKGDGREDLHNLYNAIQKCMEWYWDEANNDILFLFGTAIEGLEKLKKTYSRNSTIQHTLDYYIHYLKGNNMIVHNDGDMENFEGNGIHQYLKDLWNEREIKIVIEMFKEFKSKRLNDDYKNEEENFLKSINTLTETKDRKLSTFLEEHHTVL